MTLFARSTRLNSGGETRLATGSDDNTALIVEAATGKKLVQVMPGCDVGAITRGGRDAISANSGTIEVWDIKISCEPHEVTRHMHMFKALAVGPDGRDVVSASTNNTLKLWDVSE